MSDKKDDAVMRAAALKAIQVAGMPEIDRTDAIYARALDLAHGSSNRPNHAHAVLNAVYYGLLFLAFAWVFSMVIDRDMPVHQIAREIVNPGRQVHIGDRLSIRSVRDRNRQCELTRRWWLIDGNGRRLDYEPEHFDAYGALGRESEIVGPVVPLDAAPGRGRIYVAVAYDCNALQRALGWSITSVLPPLDFEILPRATP